MLPILIDRGGPCMGPKAADSGCAERAAGMAELAASSYVLEPARTRELWRNWFAIPVSESVCGVVPGSTPPPASGSDPPTLLRDCEQVLKRFAKRWRRRWSTDERRQLRSATNMVCMNSIPALRAVALPVDIAAWLLWSMHWWGISHVRLLELERVHVATQIVRWLTLAPVAVQHAGTGQTLHALLEALARTQWLWCSIAERMKQKGVYFLDGRIVEVRFLWHERLSF